jgi:hypothetical protein
LIGIRLLVLLRMINFAVTLPDKKAFFIVDFLLSLHAEFTALCRLATLIPVVMIVLVICYAVCFALEVYEKSVQLIKNLH